MVVTSVADLGCLSRIKDPEFYPSRIPDPGSNNSTKRRGGNFFVQPFFCSHKYHKISSNFIFEQVKKKMGLGSGIRIQVRKAAEPGSGSATLVVTMIKRWHN
jgi:hypothetical protein